MCTALAEIVFSQSYFWEKLAEERFDDATQPRAGWILSGYYSLRELGPLSCLSAKVKLLVSQDAPCL